MANLKLITKKAAEEFEKVYEEDISGNKPREVCLGCYECGEQIDVDGVKTFLTQAIEEAVRSALESTRGHKKVGLVVEDWEASLNIDERFGYLDEQTRRHILAEIKHQRQQAYSQAVAEQEQKVKEFLK